MIDWTRVHVLRNDIGADGFDDIVDIFLEEVDEVIGKLRGPQARATLEQDLHFLKNCALNLGFADLSRLCQIGEKQAASGGGADVDLPHILAVFDQSRAAFLSELPAQMDA